jgi:energy-converting hydrogenase Eha subunit C
LTTRAAKAVGRYFNLMMWALPLPVVIMVAVYQIGVVTGIPIAIYRQDEPYFFISALLLVPIAIVLFLLAAQRRIIAHLEKGPEGIGKS